MNPTQPGKLIWLMVLAAFWAFYGMTGRDAWQAEEAMALASVLDQLQDRVSIWTVPAPLFTLVAGLFARIAPLGLDIQDSARLASGFFTLSAVLGIALAARHLLGKGYGAATALALMGGFGLLLRAHAFIPETALLAVWALLLWGMSWSRTHPRAGGTLLGLSLAALTLGLRGLPDLAVALGVMLLPLVSNAWREQTYRQALVLGLSLGAVMTVAGLAHMASSGHLLAWLEWHGLQRLIPSISLYRLFSDLAWFAWPLWPLALAAVWHDHRRLARSRELHLPLLALVLLLAASVLPSWSRMGGLLPLLLPLALLAAQALAHLRRGAAQAFYWFGVLCFLFFSFAFWVYFAAIEWGFPTKLASHVAKLTPSYVPGSVSENAIWLAAGATLLWLVATPLFPRAQTRPVLVWSTGMVLVWVLLSTLFRPWAEAGWGYRPLLLDMASKLPPHACLETQVDPAMETMVRYHLAPRLRPDPQTHCTWRLTQVSREEHKLQKTGSGEIVWASARPRSKKLVYRLEHRHED